MAHVKVKINPTIKISASDYYGEVTKYPAPSEPEFWVIDGNNGAMMVFPDKTYTWISALTFNALKVVEDTEAEIVQPSPPSFDGNTLLKAIAIAQKPELAVALIKD